MRSVLCCAIAMHIVQRLILVQFRIFKLKKFTDFFFYYLTDLIEFVSQYQTFEMRPLTTFFNLPFAHNFTVQFGLTELSLYRFESDCHSNLFNKKKDGNTSVPGEGFHQEIVFVSERTCTSSFLFALPSLSSPLFLGPYCSQSSQL